MTLVAANVALPDPAGVKVVRVETTEELRDAVVSAAGSADAVVMAAAPADFRPVTTTETKIKKAADGSVPALELTQTPDILAEISHDRLRPGQVVVGFAAETGDDTGSVLDLGRAKLARKGCDLLVVNDVRGGAVFGADDNQAVILGVRRCPGRRAERAQGRPRPRRVGRRRRPPRLRPTRVTADRPPRSPEPGAPDTVTGRLFTSESVTEGHPDKIADQISDSVLDEMIRQDAHSRVAVETLLTTGLVVVAGEVSTTGYVDIKQIVRDRILKIGYDSSEKGFDGASCGVMVAIGGQSGDIAQGVDSGHESRTGSVDAMDKQGAGDQGLMFGYACDDTDVLMPLPIVMAQRLAERLTAVRNDGTLSYLRPDGKTQVTIEYDADNRPVRVNTVVLSTQHAEDVDLVDTLEPDIKKHVIDPVLATFPIPSDGYRLLVNPTGRFVVGGPMGDAGLTGRKIIVDTYGGMARHGGGAFSGKDPPRSTAPRRTPCAGSPRTSWPRGSRRAARPRSPTRSARPSRSVSSSRRSAPASWPTRRSSGPCSRSSTSVRPPSSRTSTCCARSTPSPRRTATSGASCPSSPGSAPTGSRSCARRPASPAERVSPRP